MRQLAEGQESFFLAPCIGLDTNNLSVEGKAALRRQCATAPDLSLYL